MKNGVMFVPLIPPAKLGGRRREVNVREVLNGIMYVLKWVDVVEKVRRRKRSGLRLRGFFQQHRGLLSAAPTGSADDRGSGRLLRSVLVLSSASGGCTAWHRDIGRAHANETAQILNGGHQQKLLGGSAKASELQPRKAELPFHVSEQHLDLFAKAA